LLVEPITKCSGCSLAQHRITPQAGFTPLFFCGVLHKSLLRYIANF